MNALRKLGITLGWLAFAAVIVFLITFDLTWWCVAGACYMPGVILLALARRGGAR